MPGRRHQTPSSCTLCAGKLARTTYGCDRAGHGRPSRSPSRRSAERLHGSSRTGRLLPQQSSTGHKLWPSIARVPCSTAWRSVARHHNRPHSRAHAVPQRSGSASVARGQACPHCLSAARRGRMSIGPVSAAAECSARIQMMSPLSAAPCGPCSATPSGLGRSP